MTAERVTKLSAGQAGVSRDAILVEWFFNKIKQCRHSATRYDNFAAN